MLFIRHTGCLSSNVLLANGLDHKQWVDFLDSQAPFASQRVKRHPSSAVTRASSRKPTD